MEADLEHRKERSAVLLERVIRERKKRLKQLAQSAK
jgi:hypothetical protein